MVRRSLASLTATAAVILAACASGGASGVPTSPGASPCKSSADSGVVAVSIEDFAFVPAAVQAAVGQVIAFRNTGFESHNATLDNGGCGTATLETDGTDGLIFSVAGSYPFHCTVHAWMKGTITIGP